jgi:hypothetical protein
MSKHTVSLATEMYAGKGRYAPLLGSNGRTGVPMMAVSKISMGSPIVGDPNGIVVSQDLTALGVFSVSATAAVAIAAGALAGVMDVPRNIVAAWTGTAVITITGTDVYDNVMSEASASGTSLAGTKAFKTVSDVTVSGDVTSLTVGTGDVLGLPYVLTAESDVLAFYADAVEEKLASVFVAADATVATTTTGDVRGTVNPDTTLDGSVELVLWMHVQDNGSKQGLVGVTQA